MLTARFKRVAAIACTSLSALAAPALADPIPYGPTGTPNPTTYSFTAAATGDVIAYFAGSSAAYTESIGLEVNGVLTAAGFGLQDHTSTMGQSFDFGAVTAGDVLTFVLNVTSPAIGFVYSDPALNTAYDANASQGHNHVYSTAYTATNPILGNIPTGTYVAFEDLPFPNSDFNYRDETYVFTNIAAQPTGVPEPTPLAAAAVGVIALGTLRRAR